MKKLLLSVMLVGAALCASAQDGSVRFGIKAGATFPNVSVSEDFGLKFKTNTSFYAGATVDISVSDMFSVQPGLTFMGKGFKLDESVSDEDGNVLGSVSAKANLFYIEVPVNILVNIPVGENKVFLGAGPYYGMGITGTTKVKGIVGDESVSESEDIEFGDDGEFKRADYGINFLAGYQLFNGFNIHAGYGLGLADINAETDPESDEVVAKIKNRVI